MKCYLCPNLCGVDREKTDGPCRADAEMRVCRIAPHFGEEPIISGTRGSGTVFFSGCGMDCEFCQNHEISKKKTGMVYSPRRLAEAIGELEAAGVHNINFVTPTHFSDKIIETLRIYRPKIPIVYNTSGYERAEIIRALAPYVDIFLTDFKYGNNGLGKKYSGRPGYYDCCMAATTEMVGAKKLLYAPDGTLAQGVMVRHLMLPGEWQNTAEVIDLFAERWKDEAVFSLMSQFFPAYRSGIRRTLKPVEYKLALGRLQKLGVENCFVQELASASGEYVPSFITG